MNTSCAGGTPVPLGWSRVVLGVGRTRGTAARSAEQSVSPLWAVIFLLHHIQSSRTRGVTHHFGALLPRELKSSINRAGGKPPAWDHIPVKSRCQGGGRSTCIIYRRSPEPMGQTVSAGSFGRNPTINRLPLSSSAHEILFVSLLCDCAGQVWPVGGWSDTRYTFSPFHLRLLVPLLSSRGARTVMSGRHPCSTPVLVLSF